MRAYSRFHRPNAGRHLVAGLAAVALLSVGCGEIAENLVEEGVEKAIESDTGENVELDFDGEDGLTIETDEGSMTIDEDGSFVIEGADGEVVTGETTDDGYTVSDEDGNAVFDVDEENGVVTAETEDGSFTSGPGIPDAWPGSVPEPAGLEDINGSTITTDGQILMTATGTASQGATEYFESYAASLEDDGYERSSYFESDGVRQGSYENGEYTINLVGDDGSSTIAITLMSAPG